MISTLQAIALSLLLLKFTSQAPAVNCRNDLFGTPDSADCFWLLSQIADWNDDQPRIFDEEQLRNPSALEFPGFKNIYPTEIVQMPSFWSFSAAYSVLFANGSQTRFGNMTDHSFHSIGTCNIALLSHVDPTGIVALSASSWRNVRTQGDAILNQCLRTRRRAGGLSLVESRM